MRAIKLDGQGAVDLVNVPEPTPQDDELVIAPKAIGICGTDIHLASGDYPTGRFPVTPGHEFAGTVIRVGKSVTQFKIGDRVCVDPNVNCGQCRECRRGATNLCHHLVPIGVVVDGACAEQVCVPEKVVYALPDQLDWTTGALVEPLACVLHGFDRIDSIEGKNVLIYGAGSIGLMSLSLARAGGAARIDVIEPSAVRRAAAREFGADATFAPGERTATRDVDLVVEASGHPDAVADAIERLGNRGILLQMGVVSSQAAIDFYPYVLFEREITMIGSQSLARSYGDALSRISELDDLTQKIVTHIFDLADYADALATAQSEVARKVVVFP